MATVTLLGSTFDTNSGTHTVTVTPAVGDLIVIISANTGNTSTATPTDDQSGTYVSIISALKNASADALSVFIRTTKIISPVSTVFTHAVGASSGGGLAVLKVTGINKLGSVAARQSVRKNDQSAGGTPAPVFTNTTRLGNPIIGAVFNATNPAAMTPRTSYSELLDTGYSVPTSGIEIMVLNSGEASTSIAWGGISGSAFCDIAIELDAPSGQFFPFFERIK